MEEPKIKPKRLIRRPAVIDRVALETTQIYDLIRENKFPAPVPIGPRAVAWVESEIDAWIEARIRERANIKNLARSGSIKKSVRELAVA